eukprot:746208-Hanusia_phi.AAC.3
MTRGITVGSTYMDVAKSRGEEASDKALFVSKVSVGRVAASALMRCVLLDHRDLVFLTLFLQVHVTAYLHVIGWCIEWLQACFLVAQLSRLSCSLTLLRSLTTSWTSRKRGEGSHAGPRCDVVGVAMVVRRGSEKSEGTAEEACQGGVCCDGVVVWREGCERERFDLEVKVQTSGGEEDGNQRRIGGFVSSPEFI